MKRNSFGVGTDLEDVARFRGLDASRDSRFLRKVYNADELKYCFSKKDPAPHLAARFAGKEAVYKAFSGIGATLRSISDVAITRSSRGAPGVSVKGRKGFEVGLSLSHAGGNALAFAVVCERK